MSKIRFNPEITLGHIIHGLTMLGALVALWLNLNNRVTVVEVKQAYEEQKQQDLARSFEMAVENQNKLIEILRQNTHDKN